MIKKILQAVFYTLSFFVGISFLILNIIHYRIYLINNLQKPMEYHLRFNIFEPLSDKEYSFLILGLTGVVFAYLLYRSLKVQYIMRTEYDGASFVKKASLFEKKQGTIRVEYDKNGEITRNTYLCYIDEKFNPIKKLQNKIVDYYNLGYTKKWNAIRTFDYEQKEEKK